MERLDLASGDRVGAGQLRDGSDFDAVGSQGFAGAVGGEYLDLQGEQLARERDDALPACHREQGSHQAYLPAA